MSIEDGTYAVFRAEMNPSGKQFDSLPDQSLLESGLAAGVALPFGCANGSCGECRARITQGDVRTIKHHDYALTDAQKLTGYCLLCSSTAASDVLIEVEEAASPSDIAPQQLQAKPCRVEHVQDIDIITFKFTRGKALRFLPGQRANISFADGEQFELPISSCPCHAQYLEFHLPQQPLGTDEQLARAAKRINAINTRERVTITGPVGQFTLSPAVRKPKLFIAEGYEFAQLQGLVEQVLNHDLGIPTCLLWMASDEIKHYRSNWCRSWHDAVDEFAFVPAIENTELLSVLPPEWRDRLTECEVYLGAQNDRLIQQLQLSGVKSDSIFYPR